MKNQVRPNHLRRLALLGLLFVLAFLGLGYRLVDLQVFNHDKYSTLAAKNTQRLFLEEPRRGDILDINGNPLATSLPVKKVCADPFFIGPFSRQVAEAVAPLLEYDVDNLEKRLRPSGITNAEGKVVPRRYVDLNRQVSYEDWQKITEIMDTLTVLPQEQNLPKTQRRFLSALRKKAIYAADDQKRVYPNGPLAAHVLGFVAVEEGDFNHTTVIEMTGRAGVEKWFNDQLAGTRGWRITEVDRRRRELVAYREENVEPRPGLNAILTIDLVVQGILESELGHAMDEYSPVSASAIVVRPRTGEILGMASLPNFDPNNLSDTPIDNLRNRTISDQMEPGSTFKTLVIAGALDDNLVTLTDTFDCEKGMWYYKGRALRDSHPHERLSVMEIITKSSNIGSAKIGLLMGEERLYDYVTAFGFGARTGITLGAEISGKVLRPNTREWDGLTITRMPMGQSVAVTPLQMAMAVAAIANEGWLMRPMVVKRLIDANGNLFAEYPPQPIRRSVGEKAARDMVAAMKTVVSTEGTGFKANLDDYTVAGKTGTAQIPSQGGYLRGKNVHSFIGFFPADSPEVCISVVIDQPSIGRYASQTAAPTFGKIARQIALHLKIRPDREITLEEGSELSARQGRLAAVRSLSP